MIERASYDQPVVIQPLADLCLIRVLEEPDEVAGGIKLLRSYTQGEGRSLQGVIQSVGMRVTDPDILRAHQEQSVVLFDDGRDDRYPNGLIWWRGGAMPSYLSLVLDEGTEYVMVPVDHIHLRLDDAGD